MIVSINQPAYLPWLGYFERIVRSDAHIVLDHVQFEKNSFTNRNKVRTREGSAWLTVPLRTKGRFGNLSIAGLSFAENDPWQKKHWATLRMNYSRAPFFASYAKAYEQLYEHVWDGFGPMVLAFLAQHLLDLGINTPLLFSSELGVEGTKSQLILNLCKSAGATTYLSGPLGRNYLDEGLFLESGISVIYHDYTHPIYAQHLKEFEPFMCILDLLFNHGPESRNILMSEKQTDL